MKLLGVWKNNKILTDKLPFQFNFDILKAINFKKGCYLGQ
jgi:folate-binding protein YgfZ